MNRRALGALAIVIMLLMVIIATAGLDNLPRSVRSSISASQSTLDADRTHFAQDRDIVNRAISGEPDLFRTKAVAYRDRLEQSNTCFTTASAQLAVLQQIGAKNQRTDTARAESELSKFDSLRRRCGQGAAEMRADVERWIQYKRELPQRLTAMSAAYSALHTFDVDAAAAAARKAETDWPSKKEDLESRINQLKIFQSEGEQAWDSTAQLRAAAAANKLENFDYAAFFAAADRIDSASKQLKDGAESANQLAAQLYTSWDNLVLNVETHDGTREKVRYVRTKYQDAALTSPQVTNEERWEDLDPARARDAEKQEGMVVARKAAGKYDSEADKSVQPPAIAYVAPPGQSNSYGSWQNGIWHWLPQYLILRELLNASRGPITYDHYYGWDSARRRGEVYYGNQGSGGILGRARDWANSRSGSVSGPSTGGGFYKERPKTYGSSGGYSGSQYQNRGSYSGSRYQSKGTFGSFGSRSYSRGGGFSGGGRSVGRGGRR